MINNNLNIENAKIGFRNFSGKGGKFNPEGRRNFCVFLDFDSGLKLQEDGWKVKWLQPRDEGDNPQPYLPVAVSYDNIPPKIVLVTKNGKTVLDENTVSMVDWAEIEHVDLIIRPYNWEVNGNSGVKAYAKIMYITIVEDDFANKYKNVPDSAQDSIGGCGNCEECDGNCDCVNELPF